MKVKIKRIDDSLPLPEYQTKGAVAFDLSAREEIKVPAKSMARIPTNVIIEIPAGYMLLIKDRSSTLKRTGLLTTPGFVDQDYHGPNDELILQVYNPTDKDVVVSRSDRIGQASFVRIDQAEWEEISDDIKQDNRGGFGSTG